MRAEEATRLSAVIRAAGSEALGGALDEMVRHTLAFDMSCAYLFRFNHNALLIHNGYNQSVPEKTLAAYLRGGYLLDPFYVACINEHPAGLWRMSDLAPDSFFSSGFAISRDLHPCVSSEQGSEIEEVGFIVPIRPQVAVVYSLMRNLSKGPFSDDELAELALMAPVLSAVFELHCRLALGDQLVDPQRSDVMLEDAFIDMLQGQLTDTQRYVAKLVLQGHSSTSIARTLNISEGTVKVHKHNIYQRLEISTYAELFRLFINYIARTS